MVDDQTQARPVTLEELAAITAALDAGLPRDEVLAEAGLSIEAWEAAQERWLAKLAADAAGGRLRPGRRYLALLAAQRKRVAERAQAPRAKLEGPVPVAPHAHLSPLQGARPEGARPAPAAAGSSGAGDEAIRTSPWAVAGTAARRSSMPAAMPPPPPPEATPATATPGVQAPPRRSQTLFAMPAVVTAEPLPFTKDTPRPPRPEPAPAASAKLNRTVVGELSPFASTGALPFTPPSDPPRARPTLVDADTEELPAGDPPRARPTLVDADTDELPAAVTPGPVAPPRGGNPRGGKTLVGELSPLASAKALPFTPSSDPPGPAPSAATTGAAHSPSSRSSSRPPSPDGSGLPFQRSAPPVKAAVTLPFQRPQVDTNPAAQQPGKAAPALPFQQPRHADSALPFQQPTHADSARPSRQPGHASSSPPPRQPRQRDPALPFQPPERGANTPSNAALPQPPSAQRDSVAAGAPQPTGAQRDSMAAGAPQPTGAQRDSVAAGAPQPTGAPRDSMAAGAPRNIEQISLAQYARICASLQSYPAQIPQIRAHYGLDAQRLAALHALWHERFQRDAALMARWQALVDRHKARPGA